MAIRAEDTWMMTAPKACTCSWCRQLAERLIVQSEPAPPQEPPPPTPEELEGRIYVSHDWGWL